MQFRTVNGLCTWKNKIYWTSDVALEGPIYLIDEWTDSKVKTIILTMMVTLKFAGEGRI
jgi:hypothetical protein